MLSIKLAQGKVELAQAENRSEEGNKLTNPSLPSESLGSDMTDKSAFQSHIQTCRPCRRRAPEYPPESAMARLTWARLGNGASGMPPHYGQKAPSHNIVRHAGAMY